MKFFLKRKRCIIISCLILVIVAALLGCQPLGIEDEKGNEYNRIKTVELTKSEANLLGSAGVEKHIVFEYELINPQPKWVDLWVEYYEMGEYINKITSGGFAINDNEGGGRILLTINDLTSDIMKREFVISLMGETGFSSASISVDKRDEDIVSTWETIDEEEIVFDVENTLAVMVENREGNIEGINNRVFEDDEEALRDILENDYVYILKSKFK